MGNCKDCRFWSHVPPATGGICIIASWPAERPTDKDGATVYSKANAIGPTGRGPASLVTTPDFGCVQFEQAADDAESETP